VPSAADIAALSPSWHIAFDLMHAGGRRALRVQARPLNATLTRLSSANV
jgi:hypothetical protein